MSRTVSPSPRLAASSSRAAASSIHRRAASPSLGAASSPAAAQSANPSPTTAPSPRRAVCGAPGPITGNGQLNVGANATLDIGGPTAEAISFGSNVGSVKFEDPASVTGTITGLVTGDAIDLAGIQATGAVVNGSTLTVSAGSQTLQYRVAGPGLSNNVFAIEDDQQGGTDLVLGPPGPVIAGPNSQTVFTDFPAVLGPLSIADPGPGGSGILTVIINDTTGLLAVNAVGAGTVNGDFTNTLTLTGDLTDLNAELASLLYGSGVAGNDTVQIDVTDADGLTTAESIALTTEAVPFTLPVINGPEQALYIPGTLTDVGGNIASDPYAEATGTALTLETTSTSGDIIAHGPPGAEVTGEDTDDLQITGTVSQINSYLADNWGLVALGIVVVAGIIIIWKWDDINNLIKNFSNPSTKQLKDAPADSNGLVQQDIRSYSAPSLQQNNPGQATRQPDDTDPGNSFIVTQSGLAYGFNAAGEFVLAQSTQAGDAFQVQARFQPFNDSASIAAITQVAASVGTDRVTFGIARPDAAWIDGSPATLATGGVIALSGGQLSRPSSNSYQLAWNTGEVILRCSVACSSHG